MAGSAQQKQTLLCINTHDMFANMHPFLSDTVQRMPPNTNPKDHLTRYIKIPKRAAF